MYRIAIIGDSRVGFFQHFCNTLNQRDDISYIVLTLKGRKIYELWNAALPLLRNNIVDKVYLLGGFVI